jgi:glucose/arabinose dehydrogenase
MSRGKILFGLIVVLLSLSFAVIGQIPNIQRQAYLSGFSSPVHITNAGDGTNRMFVIQQRGIIKVAQPGATTTTDFINLTSKVSQSGNERGLLGLAFHPDFESNSFFFVNYTRSSDGATVIERYKAITNNTVGDPNSGEVILVISQDFSNHNGGHIEFGPDGHLYIGMGDGGSGNDPNNRAQTITSLLGKMLRITPTLADPVPVGVPKYTVPADNPYVGINGADEIFAIGVRNPYRWSFDRGGAKKLWAADVGQFSIEEVSIIEKGKNYGWRVYEGNSCTNNDPGLCTPTNFEPPVFQYNHSQGRCSITGGYVYRGTQGTLPQGAYIYGDFCSGQYYYWDGSNQILIEDTTRSITSFGQDEAGELYIVDRGGVVERIINTQPFINSTTADFDGDGRTDLSIFRPSNGVWYINNSSDGGYQIGQFGANGDIPVPEDYDDDGKTDLAVYRPTTSEWFVFNSGNNTFDITVFGASGDIPVPGDYRNDARVDKAFYRPGEGMWYIADPGGSNAGGFITREFGISTDVPVPGDYDGDDKTDLAVFRASEGIWYYKDVDDVNTTQVGWGLSTDIPVQGDFDGDGTTDLNIFRPSEGNWYTLQSSSSSLRVIKWGISTDIPVVGDYDGDGAADNAIWRPGSGEWFILRSSDFSYFAAPFGISTDIPVPRLDTP